jgi:hypothetical protein
VDGIDAAIDAAIDIMRVSYAKVTRFLIVTYEIRTFWSGLATNLKETL